MLQYLLTIRKGDVFDQLFRHLQHHSLAQLMVELLSIKLAAKPKEYFNLDWDKDEKEGAESEEEKAENGAPELS